MLEVRDKNVSSAEARKQDISSWQEATITRLNSKAKKRFSKNRSAIIAYFTGDKPVEEIEAQYNLSTGQLLKMAENCLKQHEDGSPWGYRALIPGVLVKDHSSGSASEPPEVQDPATNSAPSTQEPQQERPADDNDHRLPEQISGGEDLTKQQEHPADDNDHQKSQQEQAVDDNEDLESTGKRPAMTTLPADVTEEPEEVIPLPSAESSDNNSVDHVQIQHDEFSPAPITELSAAAPPEAELPSSENQATSTEPALPGPDSSVEETSSQLQENSPSSESQETLIEENVPAAPAEVGESEGQGVENAEETEGTPDLAEIPAERYEATTFFDEPKQGPDQGEQLYKESKVRAVAVLDDAPIQSPSLQGARVTAPLTFEETIGPAIVKIYPLPTYARYATRTTAAHIAQRRRFVRKRWVRDSLDKTKRHRFYRIISAAMIAILLLSLLLPLGVGLAAYNIYNNVNGLAHDGVNHLMTVKDLLPTSKNDIMSVLNAGKLHQAQSQLKAAETDFIQLQQLADRPDIASIIQQVAPQYAGKLTMARHLLQVALDVSRMGQELSGVGVVAAGIMHSSPLASNSAKPLISMADISDIKGAITHALYYMDDIQQNMSQVRLSDLPISAKQKSELSAVLTQLPSIRNLIVQNQNLVDIVTWLLGVGQPRRFLVQTMDTGEL
ncbi:MAG: hypothetical protein JOZ18_12450, partial [Chloroflexi bacterium]|nr:hypothetical protein [Chloroflexota bacterium]